MLIGGFIVTGPPNSSKNVLIRGLGPSLVQAGVPRELALADPYLELNTSDGMTLVNNDWREGAASQIPAGFEPKSDQESVIVATLTVSSTGVSTYTAVLKGADGGQGVGLLEIYDMDDTLAAAQLANISTRGFVQSGDNVMIGGFILGGADAGSRVLIRALGPSLANSGVRGVLLNPTLALHDSNGVLIASNDDWTIDEQTGQSQEAEIRASTIPPDGDSESALLVRVAPGAYTVVVAGKEGGTGVGLIEVYNLKTGDSPTASAPHGH